ncbi:MAG: hypothetical protein C3F18_04005 [Nitrosomonadales bacterium]|nr:MAG: hypothetical protein C3F18_04005 [Nitrosomonadales bacterium]
MAEDESGAAQEINPAAISAAFKWPACLFINPSFPETKNWHETRTSRGVYNSPYLTIKPLDANGLSSHRPRALRLRSF